MFQEESRNFLITKKINLLPSLKQFISFLSNYNAFYQGVIKKKLLFSKCNIKLCSKRVIYLLCLPN